MDTASLNNAVLELMKPLEGFTCSMQKFIWEITNSLTDSVFYVLQHFPGYDIGITLVLKGSWIIPMMTVVHAARKNGS